MALPVTIPNTFANATASIPLSQLDTNFNTLANAVNGISDGSETLANASVTVLTAGTVDINGGAIDGTTVGTSNAAAGSFTTLNTSGAVVFNDAGADVDFRVEGDTDANLLFVDASADKVGIGTNAPTEKLQIQTASGTATTILLNQSGAGAANISVPTSTNALAFGVYSSGSSTIIERMRIDSSGNVGIGTSAPSRTLDVNGLASVRSGTSDVAVNGQLLFNPSDTVNEILSRKVNGGNADLIIKIGSTERLRIDSSGNLLLNGTSAGASAVGTLAIFNGTAPTGSVTNGIILYAEDVSSSSELKVRDEAGNVTTLSPHNFSMIPEGPSEDMAWAYYSEKGGKRINVDMLKLARMVEKLTGEKLVYTD